MKRRFVVSLFSLAFTLSGSPRLGAQVSAPAPILGAVPGQNINMVSGTEFPGGDPYLQRQNESSMAVSSRNPQHLLGGANDYRSVDIPFPPDQGKETGDAWLGVFTSIDGGQTWSSTLLPGFPQDQSATGVNSPLHQFQAATDPTVRAGTHGLFYFSGLVFDRGTQAPSGVFVATFQDQNNKANGAGAIQDPKDTSQNGHPSGNPFLYLNATLIDTGTSGQFNDKPWIAVDVPRPGRTATCKLNGKTIQSGYVYVFYTVFLGDGSSPHSQIRETTSKDCGVTWSKYQKLSQSYPLDQGTVATIDPGTGTVYVVWRQISSNGGPDAVLYSSSSDGGNSFLTGTAYTFPAGQSFDESSDGGTFREADLPTATVDGSGRVWLAFSQRNVGPLGSSRIMITTLARGSQTWTRPFAADPTAAQIPGHQFMPALEFAYGKLMLSFFDNRDDNTKGILQCPANQVCTKTSDLVEMRVPIPGSDLAAGNLSKVFSPTISDAGMKIRHTIDVRGALVDPSQFQANSNPPLAFPTARISQYTYGSRPGSKTIEQMKFNPPNFPMFAKGTRPFIGDYIDVAALKMLPGPNNTWVFNTQPSNAAVFHTTWTDNRDVRPPPVVCNNGICTQDWTQYTPVASTGGTSSYDPTQQKPACVPGKAGSRNQNVYTARITQGLLVGVKENTKPLVNPNNMPVQRAFSVFARNTTNNTAFYRFTVNPLSQQNLCTTDSSGTTASFFQTIPPAGLSCVNFVDVIALPSSTVSRSLFVNSTLKYPSVTITVAQIDKIGGNVIGAQNGGLQSTTAINPDITNPDITNPDITNPDITNPDITNPDITNPDITNFEVYDPTVTNPDITNPDITNPDITNPDITNPDITNPDITNPDITNMVVTNPDITNPDITNPDITNPDITNPDITNPDITNPDITNLSGDGINDVTFKLTNKGNTSASYSAKEFAKKVGVQCAPLGSTKCQLIVRKTYPTPIANACTLTVETQNIPISNVPNPAFVTGNGTTSVSPDNGSDMQGSQPDATVSVGPGEGVRVTLRVFGPVNKPQPGDTAVKTVGVAGGADTGQQTPAASLTITTTDLPVAVVGSDYQVNSGPASKLTSLGGFGGTSWSTTTGSLPGGISLASNGQLSGIVTATPGPYPLSFRVDDSQTPTKNFDLQNLTIDVNQLSISSVTAVNSRSTPGSMFLSGNPGDQVTVTVAVFNNGPATASSVFPVLVVNTSTAAGGGPAPTLTCTGPNGMPASMISGNTTQNYAFTCSNPTGNGFVTFKAGVPGAQYANTAASVPANVVPVTSDLTRPITVDTARPTIPMVAAVAGSNTTVPYAAGTWSNQNVTVTFTCKDNLSGPGAPYPLISGLPTGVVPIVVQVDSLTAAASATLTAETPGTTLTASCIDNASNPIATLVSFGPIMIDKTPPVLTVAGTAGPSNLPYTPPTWTNQNVTVTYSCVDNASPVANSGVAPNSPTGSQTFTQETTVSGVNASGSCVDNAGNVSSNAPLSFGPVRIDKTPPVVTGTATLGPNNTPYTAGTWTNLSPVTVTFSCTDALSGPNLSSITGNSVLAGPTQNTNIQGSCMDNAGNTGNGSFGPVLIDQIAPAIMITSPAPSQTFVLNSQISPVFTCNDAGGGDTVNCVVAPSASPYIATPVGPATFTVSATDQAGNQSRASANYTVIYNFAGFQAPLQQAVLMNPPNPPTPPQPSDSGSFTVGTTIPIAGTLQDAGNNPVADATAVTSIVAYPNGSCSGPASGAGTVLYNSTTGTAAFSYDTTKGQFLFNWNTTGLAAGCENLVVTSKDTLQWSTLVHLATDSFVGFDAPLATASAPAAPSNSGTFDTGSTIAIMWQLLNSDGTLDTAQNVNVSNVTVYSNAGCSGPPLAGAASTTLYDRASALGAFTFEPSIAVYTVNWPTGAAAAGCYDIVATLTDRSVYTTMVTLAAPGGVTTLLQYNFDNVPQGSGSQTAPPSYAAPNTAGGAFGYSRFNANGMFSNGCTFADCIDPAEVSSGEYYSFSLTNNTAIANASISFNEFNNDCQGGCAAGAAQSFSVQYDTDPAFSNPPPTTVATFTPPTPAFASYTFPIGGLPANTYYFRITATGVDHDGTAQYVLDNVTISGSH